jgi:hypothetical protein
MNRDITPSSPHPLSKVVDTATKNPRIMYWQSGSGGRGRT